MGGGGEGKREGEGGRIGEGEKGKEEWGNKGRRERGTERERERGKFMFTEKRLLRLHWPANMSPCQNGASLVIP